MTLTATAIRNAKPGRTARRLLDALGVYMEISPAGGRWWRFKYRFAGKEKQLSLGVYRDVSLAAARGRRDEARKILAEGIVTCPANFERFIPGRWLGVEEVTGADGAA